MIPRHPWGGQADPASSRPADVVLLGLPYDGAASWRTGAAEAPRRLREISHTSPAISEDGHVVDPGRFLVRDAGDVPAPRDASGGPDRTEAARQAWFDRVAAVVDETLEPRSGGPRPFLFSIGGDHSVTIPLFRGFTRALPGNHGLVLLDAHPDLFDEYEGSRTSHACPMRRALETGRVRPEHFLIFGTRSYNAVELDFMKEHGIRFVPARELARMGVEEAVALARDRLSGLPSVYLTIDIDVADPACAPGTGAPVAGGLSSRELLDLTRGLLEGLPVHSMDLVEVAPPLDPTDATLFLALQIVFETIAALDRRK
jgi:agmatinase